MKKKSKNIEHWKNISLENIVEKIDGILYVEKWKDIEKYESVYQVSTFGRIKSFHGSNQKGKILKQTALKMGYLKVGLYLDGISETKTIHTLVAKAFIKNRKNKPEVNHIKGIKKDNRVVKLEWNTSSENAQHKFDIGLQTPTWTGKKGKDNYSSKPVYQYDKKGNFIKKWDSATEAGIALGKSAQQSWISACCRGIFKTVKGKGYKVKRAYGFIWKYV